MTPMMATSPHANTTLDIQDSLFQTCKPRVPNRKRLGGAFDAIRAGGWKTSSRAVQFAVKPAFGHRPFAFDGSRRDPKGGCRLLDGQATEEPQFDDAPLTGVECRELLERRIQRYGVEHV